MSDNPGTLPQSEVQPPPEVKGDLFGIADLSDYGFQLTTGLRGEMVWLRPLSILKAEEI